MQYYHLDALGSVRVVTDESGAVSIRHDYLPFGDEWEAQPSSNPLRFTGKERDKETGLDYFGARYLSGGHGRFTSIDPNAFTKRTLENPQKWNKYAYVLNNPLALIDPNGREELRITVRAFIPEATFQYPPVVGPTWNGDGRSFSTAPDASSRAQVVFTIETDPAKSTKPLVGEPEFSTSGSRVDLYGKHTATAPANVTGSVLVNTRLADGTSVVRISMSASDPLIPGAPPTGGTLTFNVSRGGTSVSMNGWINVYPSFESYVENTNTGALGTLLQASSTNSPGGLLTGGVRNVRGKTKFPDKRRRP